MLNLQARSKPLSRAIGVSMGAHVSMQSCMHKGFIATDQRVARLMRELELVAKRPRHRTVTTKSEQGASVAPNLLQQDFHADQPNQKWTSDTTYIWTQEGWLYLAVVLDLFSRMVVGWAMAAVQDTTLVVHALEMALARLCPQAGLLHHSDRGSTSTSESYVALVQHNDMQMSMSRTANCYDNAATESFFHSFKGECIDSLCISDASTGQECNL
jgi:transposase InsO family protein